ncbi:MAG TPA: hypothetical protein PLN44_11670 [Syntrophales bacterium]|nr:hypothetical protein [Syntrophales bacterium]
MVTPEILVRWMEGGGFRFAPLEIDGIDNRPVLAVNKEEMAREETCAVAIGMDGNAYLQILSEGVRTAMDRRRPLPVVRFADGEYAFYAGSLECNGLYRQAESKGRIKEALPVHAEDLRRLSKTGFLAPLIFPGNTGSAESTLGALWRRIRNKPSAATFLAFLERHGVTLDRGNYLPFYVVYAWLSSPSFARLVDGRRVCLVNADRNDEACHDWFARLGSKPEILFAPIPPEFVATRWPSLREEVLSRIPADTEICLVGAGIGALGVCVDIAERLSIPAVDAGHVLNMMTGRVDKSNGPRLYTLWKTP